VGAALIFNVGDLVLVVGVVGVDVVGIVDGEGVGPNEGACGDAVGNFPDTGAEDGRVVGLFVGVPCRVGAALEGRLVGNKVGDLLGLRVGIGVVGRRVGATVGRLVGLGRCVGFAVVGDADVGEGVKSQITLRFMPLPHCPDMNEAKNISWLSTLMYPEPNDLSVPGPASSSLFVISQSSNAFWFGRMATEEMSEVH
jgi:hypothetical protein